MECPSCGVANIDGLKFCTTCGTRLGSRPLVCGQCGVVAAPGARFCGECGNHLGGDADTGTLTDGQLGAPGLPTQTATTERGNAPIAERRTCAVLFVDLVGFTGMSESRDMEGVRELLSSYFDLARTIIGRYGGTLEKFIGDAVMAVWGAPTAHDDDSERAVRAALDLVEAVQQLGAETSTELTARAGVVTDTVAVTVAAQGQGLVAGDAVNTASRVQGVAEPGSVYVDAATRQQSNAAIAYVDAGRHALKGKADPVELHRALRVVAGLGGSDRVDGLEASFLGRDRELRTLKETFHSSAESGRAALVSVTGVPGVGKTRLRWEFEKYIDGLVETVLWHDGRCPSYGEGIAYWALAQMVRHRLGLAEEDDGETVARKLDEGLGRWVPDEADQQFLAPRLGALLGTEDPGLGREELFAGWRLWFERLAEHNPVVLVVDDLQWADPGLLDFLEHLLEWAAGSPLFLLTLGRPELLDRRQGWGQGRRSATSLALDPLTAPTMTTLLDELVPGLPVAVRQRIIAAADGIPLYAVELVRSLVDQDVIHPVDGAYRLVGEVTDLAVPASLTSLITARIDGLPAAERSLVARLAVLGSSFPRGAVNAVANMPADGIDGVLASLVRREILTVRSERMSPERGQYAFTQALLRTVAYDTLSRHDRRARHLEVARHLRDTFPEDGAEVAEVIAEHYRDAWLAAPEAADADDVRREALTAYDRAGARALTIGAPETATRAYRLAAELAEDAMLRAEHLQKAGDAAEQAGQPELAMQLHGTAATAFDAVGRVREAAWCRLQALRAKGSRGISSDADVAEVRASVKIIVGGADDDALAVQAHTFLAGALVFTGDLDGGVAEVERALDLAQALDLPKEKAGASILKGISLVARDRNDEALMYYEWAIALAQKHNYPLEEMRGRVCAGDQCMISDLPGAVEHSREGMLVAQRRGDRQSEMFLAGNLVLSQIFAGDWGGADQVIQHYLGGEADPDRAGAESLWVRVALLSALRGQSQAADDAAQRIRDWDSSVDIQARTGYQTVTAVMALSVGDLEHSLRIGTTALDDAVRLGIRHEATRVIWPAVMEAALRSGRLREATDLFAVVADRPPGQLPPYLRAEVAHYRARLAEVSGETEGVAMGFTSATEELRRLGYSYFLARVLSDHGAWLLRQGRADEATPLVAEAAGILRGLRAAPALGWLERDTDQATQVALV
ncbi:MAG: AAA family ATPase [Sporichthyaceae bacterium]|nr:AAA family ATPase [Sporichthyaceae bacterium]